MFFTNDARRGGRFGEVTVRSPAVRVAKDRREALLRKGTAKHRQWMP
jgi:hypothetical protein